MVDYRDELKSQGEALNPHLIEYMNRLSDLLFILARRVLAEPVEGTLHFAGEATDTGGQASTVAGAIASGDRAAGQILRGGKRS